MALITTSLSGFSNQLQGYFDKQLLEHVIQALHLNDYAKKAELPKNVGSKTFSFFRPVSGASANVQTLVEGTPIATFTSVTYTKVDATLVQYGEAIKYTDLAGYTQLFDVLKQGVTLMGEDCALKADDITSTEIATNLATASRRYAQQAGSWATLTAATVANGKLIVTDLLDSATQLKIARSPKINNSYVAIMAPQVSRDVMNDNDWLEASKYSAVGQLFKGEVGQIHGIRIVEATNAWREAVGGAENTFAAGGGVFHTVITGKDGYAVVDLATQSPLTPRMIVTDKADKSDPLNQVMTAGWKAFYGAKIANDAFIVGLRSLTQYS